MIPTSVPGFLDTIARPFTRAQVADLFAVQRREDAPGMAIHTLLAAGACFMGGWPTFAVAWAGLPVLVCFLVRMTGRHAILQPLWRDPVLWLAGAWVAWLWLSGAWSAAAGTPGFWPAFKGDVGTTQFVALVPVLWAVMDRRRTLAAALVLGIACGQCSQVVHALTVAFHAPWQPYGRAAGRLSGWWDPAVSGSILCAGLGMHLGAAVFAPGARGRWVGTAGAVGTLACIGLTGTRGAWLGAAALGAISLVIGAWRVRPARRVLWPLGAGAVLAAALAAAGIAVALSAGGGSGLGARVRSGVGEVRAAFTSRDYTTDTGLRVAMWRWAWAAVKAHPGNGVGAGGYAAWCRSLPAEQAAALGAPAETARNVHAHAHSWYLHTLATTGVAGAGPLFLMTALAVRAGLRSSDAVARAAPARALGHELLDAYAAGPPLAILGLACAGVFDPITTNQQTSYLFWTLVALCLPMAAGLDEPPAAPAPPAPPAPPGEATP